MKPIGKYIVLKPIEEEIKSQSGMLLSGADAEALRYRHGEVVAVGTDVTVIKEGDKIFFDKSHSFTMLLENGKFSVIQERDVVVVE